MPFCTCFLICRKRLAMRVKWVTSFISHRTVPGMWEASSQVLFSCITALYYFLVLLRIIAPNLHSFVHGIIQGPRLLPSLPDPLNPLSWDTGRGKWGRMVCGRFTSSQAWKRPALRLLTFHVRHEPRGLSAQRERLGNAFGLVLMKKRGTWIWWLLLPF